MTNENATLSQSTLADLDQALESISRTQQVFKSHLLRSKFLTDDCSDSCALADKLIAQRKARHRHFPASCFGEPIWDILLDLFVAAERGKDISVSSACVASNVPNTTALRYLAFMTEEGMIERHPHPHDSRVFLLSLAPDTVEAVKAYLKNVAM